MTFFKYLPARYTLSDLKKAVKKPWREFAEWADNRILPYTPLIPSTSSLPEISHYKHGYHIPCGYWQFDLGGYMANKDSSDMVYRLLWHWAMATPSEPPSKSPTSSGNTLAQGTRKRTSKYSKSASLARRLRKLKDKLLDAQLSGFGGDRSATRRLLTKDYNKFLSYVSCCSIEN